MTTNRKLIKKIIPDSLWNRQFTIAWTVSFIIFILFDIQWCALTTFRSMSFIPTYLFALTAATLFTLPTVLAPKQKWIQLTVWLLLSILLIINIMYFRTYFTAIPASSYLLAGNLNDFRSSVTDSLRISDSLLILVSVAGYIILKLSRQKCRKAKILPYGVTLGCIALISAISTIPYNGMIRHIRFLTQQCYYTNCPPVIYTVFGKIASDISATKEKISPEDKALVDRILSQNSNIQADITAVYPARNRLIFIFLESIESWPLEKVVEGQEITPNINRYIADSTTFYARNVVTQVGNGRSIDAQLLNLTGLYPMQNEVYAMTRSNNTYPSLIKALKERDPQTRAYLLTGDKATVWNQVRVASAFGIDTLLDAAHWKITDKIGNPPKLSDDALFSQIIDKCKSGEIMPVGEPAFLQIIAYSSHNPFIIPENKRHISINGKYPEKFADYITAVNYVDNSLSDFINYLQERPDWDSTMVVIIGDHEGLAVYRDKMLEDKVTGSMTDPAQHTPFIILNAPCPGKFIGEMGQVDVYSTLLDMLNLNGYSWHGLGCSVLNGSHHSAAVDSRGNIIASEPDSITSAQKEWLITARKASDIILKFDMLKRDDYDR